MRERLRALLVRFRDQVTGGESEQGLWTGVFVLVLALVAAAVLILAGGGGSGPLKQPPAALPTSTMDAAGAWNPYAEVPGAAGAASRAAAQWTPVVRTFVNTFLGASHDPHWLARARPAVTPQLLGRLRHVQRRKVPTGAAGDIKVQASGTYSVDLTVSFGSGSALGVRVVDLPKDDRGWMVYSYESR
ncbi:MAG TPA: hypothetical protein VJ872_11415 [Nocardioides sp.]|nr:hypothetical protein [Nocardioides sp.]